MKSILILTAAFGTFGIASQSSPSPEQKLSQQFLSELDTLLQSDAGSTSFTRMSYPTLHGRSRFDADKDHEKQIAETWAKLDTNHTLSVLMYGGFDKTVTTPITKFMYGNYQINDSRFVDGMPYAQSEKELIKNLGPTKAQELWNSNRESLEFQMDYAGHKAFIEMKVVKAQSDQCISCHTGATKGSKVGIVALLRISD